MMLTSEPCPLCFGLARAGKIHVEAVQRVAQKPYAPMSRFQRGVYCCHDCAAAEGLVQNGLTFEMTRIAVANDRQEQYRLPGAPIGLVGRGLMRPSEPGDLQDQIIWLDSKQWFGLRREEES